MFALRREKLIDLLNNRFKGDRGTFLKASGLTKGRLSQLLKEWRRMRRLLRSESEQLAERMGTTKSAVSRLEASLRSPTHSPSFATLRKYAHACGKRLVVTMV